MNAEGVRFADDSGNNLQGPIINHTDAVVNMVGDKAMYDALEANKAGLVADLESRGVLFMQSCARIGVCKAIMHVILRSFLRAGELHICRRYHIPRVTQERMRFTHQNLLKTADLVLCFPQTQVMLRRHVCLYAFGKFHNGKKKAIRPKKAGKSDDTPQPLANAGFAGFPPFPGNCRKTSG